jgi:hypothetical protein
MESEVGQSVKLSTEVKGHRPQKPLVVASAIAVKCAVSYRHDLLRNAQTL